jgi:hypothetical protein
MITMLTRLSARVRRFGLAGLGLAGLTYGLAFATPPCQYANATRTCENSGKQCIVTTQCYGMSAGPAVTYNGVTAGSNFRNAYREDPKVWCPPTLACWDIRDEDGTLLGCTTGPELIAGFRQLQWRGFHAC